MTHMPRTSHAFDPHTQVCVWCGFGVAEAVEAGGRLALCPVPIEKRKFREIITVKHGVTTITRTPMLAGDIGLNDDGTVA